MSEIDITSGFSMNFNNDDNQPNIIIDNQPDRAVVPLGKGDSLTDNIDVVLEKQMVEKEEEKKETPHKPEPKIIKEPPKKSERIQRIDSYTTNSDNSSYIEYVHDAPKSSSSRSNKLESANVPIDFGDIADPMKHKENSKPYDDQTDGTRSIISDSDSYYSRSETPQPREKEYSSSSYGRNDYRREDPEPKSHESRNSRYMREEEEKQDLLIKLQSLENKGVRLTKIFSMKSHIDDLRFEYEKQKSILERDQSVDFMKNVLVTFVQGVEMLNGKFDPIGAKLNGWSESIMENIGTYESIFERLHEKYQGTVEIAPELELLMTLASSAFMFHMMQTVFKQAIPNLPQAMMQDPNLMRGLASATARAADMSNNQNAQQRGNYGTGGVPTPSNQTMGGPSQGLDIMSLMGSMMGGMNLPTQGFQNPLPRPVNPRNEPPLNFQQSQQPQPQTQRDDDVMSTGSGLSNLSDGSGIRISKSKSDKKIIDLGNF